MARTLFELAAGDARIRFSPYCWRVRMALAHKGLDVETVAWRFVEKQRIAFADSEKVPVLVDDGVVVYDSMAIAEYLERRYPERPSLFCVPGQRQHEGFVRHWTESQLFPRILRQILVDLVRVIDPGDRDYFRATREQRLAMTLEAFCADRDERLPELRSALQPLRATVSEQPFLGGEGPTFGDYIVFSAFQWARCGAGRDLIDAADPIDAWMQRMLALFDGLGARAACASGHHPPPRHSRPCAPPR